MDRKEGKERNGGGREGVDRKNRLVRRGKKKIRGENGGDKIGERGVEEEMDRLAMREKKEVKEEMKVIRWKKKCFVRIAL